MRNIKGASCGPIYAVNRREREREREAERERKGEREGERKGRTVCVDTCTRVTVAHASVLPSSLRLPPTPRRAGFIVSARMHSLSSYTDRFVFFPALLSRFPAPLLLTSMFLSFFFSPPPPLPSPSFFFYFPTIIIPSNFAHSKRWRKFVEVTPRENAEDSVQNKEPWGWLSLFPTRRKRGALRARKRRRGGLERILLVKCRARRSR